MNTLTYASTTMALPDNLAWEDEFSWQRIEQRIEYSITGAMLVEAGAKQAGRPITLTGDDAWMLRSDMHTLRAWGSLPAQAFTLVFQGMTYSVAFDHARGPVDGRPVAVYSDPTNGDFYVPTLRFLEI